MSNSKITDLSIHSKRPESPHTQIFLVEQVEAVCGYCDGALHDLGIV